MNEYRYKGPVRNLFGDIRKSSWDSMTMAVSKKKALSNLCYRYSVINKCPVWEVKLNPKYLTLVREGV